MSLLQKKDVGLLLDAGFSPEDLGLSDGTTRGVEIYESPDDYFAKELIENAAEAGEVDLMDEPSISDEEWTKVAYDNSRKGLYDDNEYAGNEDWDSDVPPELREQAEWLKTVKLGKLTIWQRKSPKGEYEWQVKGLNVEIGEEDKERYSKMSKEYKKELWINYAKDEWKKVWVFTVDSLKSYPIEEKIEYRTKTGYPLKLIAISADNVRSCGYKNLPPEARWITIVYFDKDTKR